MLTWFKERAARRETASELYGVVVARAREPLFYRDWGVPDTPEGRYEMVALHLVLVLERLRVEGTAGQRLSRETIEAFVADMDDSMREMGVGDLTVPKKVKSAAAGVYARAEAFRAALAADAAPDALAAAIQRLTFGTSRDDTEATTAEVDARRAQTVARYVRNTSRELAGITSEVVLAGRITFQKVSA